MGNHVLACAFCRSPLVDNNSPGDVAGHHDTSCCLPMDDLLQHGGWNHQVRLRMDVCTVAASQPCCRSCLRFSYNSIRWLHTPRRAAAAAGGVNNAGVGAAAVQTGQLMLSECFGLLVTWSNLPAAASWFYALAEPRTCGWFSRAPR